MAWCHQATSQYLSQCWPTSMLPYDIISLQWVNHVITWIFYYISLRPLPVMVSGCLSYNLDPKALTFNYSLRHSWLPSWIACQSNRGNHLLGNHDTIDTRNTIAYYILKGQYMSNLHLYLYRNALRRVIITNQMSVHVLYFNPLRASLVYIKDANFIITVCRRPST